MDDNTPVLMKPSLDLLDKQKLGYKKLRQFFCKKNNYPRFLFKYKEFNRLHLEDFLVNSLLYLSSFTELNDPYDCKSRVIFSRNGRDRIMYLSALKKSNKANYATAKKMNAQLGGPKELEARINIARQGIVNTTGIHSFSTTSRNLLMWSHYSGAHRGVCLIFDTARDVDVFSHALPVKYSEEYPTIKHPNFEAKELITKSFLTKSRDWAYESERRLALQSLVNKKISYKSKALFGIILGMKSTDQDILMIKELLEMRKNKGLYDIKVFKASQSDSKYRPIYKLDKSF